MYPATKITTVRIENGCINGGRIGRVREVPVLPDHE